MRRGVDPAVKLIDRCSDHPELREIWQTHGREGPRACEAESTWVSMRTIEPAEIEAYVASGEWLDKAGGYAIQENADAFVSRLEGEFDNVVGLPLSLTARLLGPLVGPDARLCDCATHPLQRGAPRCCE